MRRLSPCVALAGLVAAACTGSGKPPSLSPLSDQVVAVGEELVIVLTATDPDQDELFYEFSADAADIETRASLSRRPDGSAVFRWRPVGNDIGMWLFDFTVTDGTFEDSVTITIEVRSAVGEGSAPVFREPLGTGTTLDLSMRDCLDLDVVVEDSDSPTVTLGQEPPLIDGAHLDAQTGLTGRWGWCPDRNQIAADDDRFNLILSADDGDNPKVTKGYVIVLREADTPGCPGDPPVVTHTAHDEETLVGLTLDAEVSDDAGLKQPPLLYYSKNDPGAAPDLGAMTQVDMMLIDGDMQSGTWAADVPNPVAGGSPGDTADVYYVIVATDDDDSEGDCDHRTQAPSVGAYHMTVTHPGAGEGGAGLCEPCTSDEQCGDVPDLCVVVGAAGDSFCLVGCASPGDCPADTTCAAAAVESVDGTSARQCVPDSGSCVAGPDECVDDDHEDDDSLTDADGATALAPGSYDLVSCPVSTSQDDEDWFKIAIAADSQVTLELDGTSATDLDLALYDHDGGSVATSGSLTSTESIEHCLVPGTYFARVYAWGSGENPYTLDYSRAAGSCAPSCTDDDNEDDDSDLEARPTDIYPDPFVSENNAICAGDDDWFAVELFSDETVLVDLTFLQSSPDEDLDLHFYDDTGADLTPCTEAAPDTCTIAQGQSADSDEQYEHTVTRADCGPCTYYVVVHGWDGSENVYDLQISLE